MSSYDSIDAATGRIKVVAGNPLLPEDYYGRGVSISNTSWVGGEIVYNTTDARIYVQRNTSGRTPEWRRTANKNAFGTSTTSSSTSSSSSSSSTSSSSTTTMA